MKFSNYPPGVSGMEDQIAGPRAERDEIRQVECGVCDWEGYLEMEVTYWFAHETAFWRCPVCGHDNEERWG